MEGSPLTLAMQMLTATTNSKQTLDQGLDVVPTTSKIAKKSKLRPLVAVISFDLQPAIQEVHELVITQHAILEAKRQERIKLNDTCLKSYGMINEYGASSAV